MAPDQSNHEHPAPGSGPYSAREAKGVVLDLAVGEQVIIGDPHNPLGTVRVMEVHIQKTRLGFDFPRDTAINRGELARLKADS